MFKNIEVNQTNKGVYNEIRDRCRGNNTIRMHVLYFLLLQYLKDSLNIDQTCFVEKTNGDAIVKSIYIEMGSIM